MAATVAPLDARARRDAARRGLLPALGVVLGPTAVAEVGLLLAPDRGPALPLAVVALVHAVAAVRAVRGVTGRVDLLPLAAASAGVELVSAITGTGRPGPAPAAGVALVLAAALVLDRAAATAVVVTTAAGVAALRTVAGPGDPGAALAHAGLLLAVAAAVAGLTRTLGTTSRRQADARRTAGRARAAATTSAGEEDGRRELQRVLHDEVVTALRSVQLYPSYPDPIGVRRACTAALATLDRVADAGTPRRLRARLHELAATAPVLVRLTVRDEGALDLDLPPTAADAVLAATAELLRNVARHSGCAEATVDLARAGRAGIVLRVGDTGVGFTVTDTPGFGLSRSVVQRMAAVGGAADVRSTPGRGTTVALTWTPLDPGPTTVPGAGVRRWREVAAAVGDVRAALLAVTLPFLVLHLAGAAVASGTAPHPLGQLGLAALLAVVVLVTAHRVGRGPLRGWAAAALVVVATTATAGALALDEDALPWVLGLATLVLVPVGLLRRPAEVVVGAIATGTVLLVVADPSSPRPAALVAALLGQAVAVAAVLAFSGVLRRAGAAVVADTATARRIANAAAVGARREQLRRWRTASLAADVLPFLEAVARDEVDLDHPATSTRAEELSTGVRDELALAGPVGPDLRHVLTRVRRAGGRVVVHSDPEADLLRSPAPRDLLRAALEGGGTPARVVLSVYERPRAEAHLVVVPGGDTVRTGSVRTLVAALGGTVRDEPDSLVATVPLSGSRPGSAERPTAADRAPCRSISP